MFLPLHADLSPLKRVHLSGVQSSFKMQVSSEVLSSVEISHLILHFLVCFSVLQATQEIHSHSLYFLLLPQYGVVP